MVAAEIRHVGIEDFETLKMIYDKTNPKGGKKFGSYPMMDWIKYPRQNQMLLAFVDEKPAGFIIAQPRGRKTKIVFLRILKAFEKKGTRKQLLDAITSTLDAGRTVEMVVPRSSAALTGFFRRHGFEQTETYPGLFGSGKTGALFSKTIELPVYGRTRALKEAGEREKPQGLSGTRGLRTSILERNLRKLDEILD